MILAFMNEAASEISGESVASNVSLVRRGNADTGARIGEEQLAAVPKRLGWRNRMFVTGGVEDARDEADASWPERACFGERFHPRHPGRRPSTARIRFR